MSDERKMKAGKSANDEVKPEDVEAHVKVRETDEPATDEPDDDVEAHVRSGR